MIDCDRPWKSPAFRNRMRRASPTSRSRVFSEITRNPSTAEEVAERLSSYFITVRARCTDLKQQGAIRDSGARRAAHGGGEATVWEPVPGASIAPNGDVVFS